MTKAIERIAGEAWKKKQREVDEQYTTLNIARAFRDEKFTAMNMPALHFWSGEFHHYDGVRYEKFSHDELVASLWLWLEEKALNPTRKKVAEISEALRVIALLPSSTQLPCWLGSKHSASKLDVNYLITTSSGMLNLLDGSIHELTPEFFSHRTLPVEFDPDAPAPERFEEFILNFAGDDIETFLTIQEIFGYLLTAKTSYQKAFLFISPKRGGKGTIGRILRALLGSEIVAGPTLSSLSGTFGMEQLIGKNVAIVGDARLNGRAEWQVIAERILSITGEDTLSIDRKFRTGWTGALPTRFVIMSNELPRLADASGALASRFIVIIGRACFFGREDHTLLEKLINELPGILNWAIEGLHRLIERGRFLQPKTSAEIVQEIEDLGAPISAFIREECELGSIDESYRVLKAHIYERWRSWCGQHGYPRPGNEANFSRELRAALPSITTVRPRGGVERGRMWAGIRLRERAV